MLNVFQALKPPSLYLKYNTVIAANAMGEVHNKEKQQHLFMQAMPILRQVNLLKFKNVIQSKNTVRVKFIEILIYIFINTDKSLSSCILFLFLTLQMDVILLQKTTFGDCIIVKNTTKQDLNQPMKQWKNVQNVIKNQGTLKRTPF